MPTGRSFSRMSKRADVLLRHQRQASKHGCIWRDRPHLRPFARQHLQHRRHRALPSADQTARLERRALPINRTAASSGTVIMEIYGRGNRQSPAVRMRGAHLSRLPWPRRGHDCHEVRNLPAQPITRSARRSSCRDARTPDRNDGAFRSDGAVADVARPFHGARHHLPWRRPERRSPGSSTGSWTGRKTTRRSTSPWHAPTRSAESS